MEQLFDVAQSAHAAIQRDFSKIDPLIGVSQNMRNSGVPADVITVDCLRTRRRIIFILHDQEPDLVRYQFTEMDDDPASEFQSMALQALDEKTFYDWVVKYFQSWEICFYPITEEWFMLWFSPAWNGYVEHLWSWISA